jgi:hypothetical protein
MMLKYLVAFIAVPGTSSGLNRRSHQRRSVSSGDAAVRRSEDKQSIQFERYELLAERAR